MKHPSERLSTGSRHRSLRDGRNFAVRTNNGKRHSLKPSDLRHIDYHTSYIIAFIDIVLSYDGSKKIPEKYRNNIIFEVRHNLLDEIGPEILKIDPIFHTRISRIINELSIAEQKRPFLKVNIFSLLFRLRTEITVFRTALHEYPAMRCTVVEVKEFYDCFPSI